MYKVMGLILESATTEAICILLVVVWFLYFYQTKNYDYWAKRGVSCKHPEFPFGSIKEIALAKTFSGKGHYNIYKLFPNERFYGIIEFRKPTLVVKDPDLIKHILVKDFQHFTDRFVILGNPKEYIVLHLVNLVGQEWKDMRAKLTPTFTSGKMKLMFLLMEKSSETLKSQLDNEINSGKNIIDVKNLLARFTLDIIASCAFGLDANTQTEESAVFFKMFGAILKTTKLRFIRRIFLIMFPQLLKMFRVNIIRPEIRDFVTNIVRATIEYRQKNNIKRNDFLDLLISLMENKKFVEDNEPEISEAINKANFCSSLTLEQITAQAFVFLVAGFETSSSLITFSLYELASHKNIQEKLYNDIKEARDKNGGEISYQMLLEIPFLDQVINETLRLYGSAQNLSRVCTKRYKIPDSDLVLEKGLKVIVPLYAIHHDPQYYPEPYEFNPERFTSEETKKRHPFVFMPFGEGPRNCIGMRFGLLQAKIGLVTMLLNFDVELSPDQEVPLEIDTQSIVLLPANPIRLKFSKRENT